MFSACVSFSECGFTEAQICFCKGEKFLTVEWMHECQVRMQLRLCFYIIERIVLNEK